MNVDAPQPHLREAGEPGRPGVVCLHSNAATGGQWKGLMERLAPAWHVLAPDAYGAGKSPPWPEGRALTLADEAALAEPALARAGAPLVLVGHSYGGSVALVAAARRPERVRALVLYEPTLFALVQPQGGGSTEDAAGIRAAVQAAGAAVDAGDLDAAARHFIDYWMGEGAWARTPAARKPAIAASMRPIRGWAGALMNEPLTLDDFVQALRIPVLLMVGGRSPRSSRSVAALLARALPLVVLKEFPSLGHMGPVTDPEVVNEAIAGFLEGLPA